LVVEHLARVTQTGDMDPRLFQLLISARQARQRLTGIELVAVGRDSTDQIEHVEFRSRMTE
jgi:hypothetical protein